MQTMQYYYATFDGRWHDEDTGPLTPAEQDTMPLTWRIKPAPETILGRGIRRKEALAAACLEDSLPSGIFDWAKALGYMVAGMTVQRLSEQYTRQTDDPTITESGEEPMRLAHAWTVDNAPVRVFIGAESKELFIPTHEHECATDWVIVGDGYDR